MSLAEAVLELAQDMEDKGNCDGNGYVIVNDQTLKDYARQLRRVVKAAELSVPKDVDGVKRISPYMPSPEEIAYRRSLNRAGEMEEHVMGNFVECVGGNSDKDLAPVDPKMPVGAFTRIGGDTYQLQEDRRLHYVRPPLT